MAPSFILSKEICASDRDSGDAHGHMISPPQSMAWLLVFEQVSKALRGRIVAVVSLTDSRVLAPGWIENNWLMIM